VSGRPAFGDPGPGAPLKGGEPRGRARETDPLRRWARSCPCCSYLRALLAVALTAVALQAMVGMLVVAAAHGPPVEREDAP
jgi:hypothetical protein